VDQLLTPRGLVLTLASFFGRGGVVLTRFDSGREVAVVHCGLFGPVCLCYLFCCFFLWGDYLTLALFGDLWITRVCCGLIVGLTLWGTYLGGAWVSVQPERGGGVFVFGFFNNTFLP
jgi:hypothetical protein